MISPKKEDQHRIPNNPDEKTTAIPKPTKLNVSLSHALVEPVIETARSWDNIDVLEDISGFV